MRSVTYGKDATERKLDLRPSVLGRKGKGTLAGMGRDNLFDSQLSELYKYGMRTGADGAIVSMPGVTRFQAVDDKGAAIKGKSTFLYEGEPVSSNEQGIFTLLDKKFLDKQLQKKRENDRYINEVTDYVSSSDFICKTVLGLSDKQYEELLGPAGTLGTGFSWGELSPELRAADCRISSMEGQTEAVLKKSIVKLRRIIDVIRPNISTTNTKETESDIEDELIAKNLK